MTHLQLNGVLATIEELDATREAAKRLANQAASARQEIKIFTNTLKTLEAEGQGKVSIGFCEGLLQSISLQLKN
jgi:hypothetical protein|tara:strand:- start:51 stop:272 length:222 start_codon:yes stop_codon:yes gene_type:complete